MAANEGDYLYRLAQTHLLGDHATPHTKVVRCAFFQADRPAHSLPLILPQLAFKDRIIDLLIDRRTGRDRSEHILHGQHGYKTLGGGPSAMLTSTKFSHTSTKFSH